MGRTKGPSLAELLEKYRQQEEDEQATADIEAIPNESSASRGKNAAENEQENTKAEQQETAATQYNTRPPPMLQLQTKVLRFTSDDDKEKDTQRRVQQRRGSYELLSPKMNQKHVKPKRAHNERRGGPNGMSRRSRSTNIRRISEAETTCLDSDENLQFGGNVGAVMPTNNNSTTPTAMMYPSSIACMHEDGNDIPFDHSGSSMGSHTTHRSKTIKAKKSSSFVNGRFTNKTTRNKTHQQQKLQRSKMSDPQSSKMNLNESGSSGAVNDLEEGGSSGRGGERITKDALLQDVDDMTVQYIDATLVKPDDQVFNPYTRFFLDPKLESLYQQYTAVYWFTRARWHMLLWIFIHVCVNLIFFILPVSGYVELDQFILSYKTVPAWLQWIYLILALPFAFLPAKINPFQTRWRTWICCIVMCFNLTFQAWLANANRLAIHNFSSQVSSLMECTTANSHAYVNTVAYNETVGSDDSNSMNLTLTEDELSELTIEQVDLAMAVVHRYSGSLIQIMTGFVSLFSFLFVILIRLEFVQVVIIGCGAATTYAMIICFAQVQTELMITISFGFAIILLFILSYSTDRTNRRSFLSNFLVEKENENLKSTLNKTKAALMNEPACEAEKQVVEHVLDVPEMAHLEMIRIPFADLTFLQAIGRGAMGDVIQAKYFGTMVVCKRIRRENITENAIISFREEIELMSTLRHPNIVQFIGASWDNCSNLCIVMEYLENGDMHSVLHSNIGKKFTWSDPLLKMALDVVQGMLYLHSQETPIVHRDLKSVNVLCSATYGCKVSDFGLSRRYKKDIDALTTLVGTPFWLAPEIIRNERYGPAADVYSFGIVLTELETRCTPYHDQEETGLKVLIKIAHQNLRPSLPPTCLPERQRLIRDCLLDDPQLRPDFAQVLARLQGSVLREIEAAATDATSDRRAMLKRQQDTTTCAPSHQ